MNTEHTITLSAAAFGGALLAATEAASTDTSRPILCTTMIERTPTGIRFVATNSHILATVDLAADDKVLSGKGGLPAYDPEAGKDGQWTRLVHSSKGLVADVKRIVKAAVATPSGLLTIEFDDGLHGGRMKLSTTDGMVSGIAEASHPDAIGTFPNYRRLVPAKGDVGSGFIVSANYMHSLAKATENLQMFVPLRQRDPEVVALSTATTDLKPTMWRSWATIRTTDKLTRKDLLTDLELEFLLMSVGPSATSRGWNS